jgi:hypothetical protein
MGEVVKLSKIKQLAEVFVSKGQEIIQKPNSVQ